MLVTGIEAMIWRPVLQFFAGLVLAVGLLAGVAIAQPSGGQNPGLSGIPIDLPTLLPSPSDAGSIDEVELPGKPAAILSGKSSWDDGFKTIFDSFKKIAEELKKAGIKPSGRPLAVFLETDDSNFSFQAMVPIDKAPNGTTSLTPDIRFGVTVSGKSIRFTHKAPYDDIDNTYEAITAYLDAKGITVKDAFVEEYASDPSGPGDETLAINIYVQPK
jgi:effector-binding domain-containing protein